MSQTNNLQFKLNKQIVFLPKRVYYEFYVAKKLDALALYIEIKKYYKTGVIKNASAKKIASLVKDKDISESVVLKHIKTLIEFRLIKKTGTKELTLVNAFKLSEYCNNVGKSHASYYFVLGSYKKQKLFLKNFIFICNIKQQESYLNSQTDKLKRSTKKNRKVLRKSDCNYAGLSIQSIAQKTQKSKTTVIRHKKKLEDMGIMSQFHKLKQIKSLKPIDVLNGRVNDYDTFKKYLIIENKVYQQLHNEIILTNPNEAPIKNYRRTKVGKRFQAHIITKKEKIELSLEKKKSFYQFLENKRNGYYISCANYTTPINSVE